jgi:hypothetical protein
MERGAQWLGWRVPAKRSSCAQRDATGPSSRSGDASGGTVGCPCERECGSIGGAVSDPRTAPYASVRLADVDTLAQVDPGNPDINDGGFHLVRRHFDVQAFGVNGIRGDTGDEMIEEHHEADDEENQTNGPPGALRRDDRTRGLHSRRRGDRCARRDGRLRPRSGVVARR